MSFIVLDLSNSVRLYLFLKTFSTRYVLSCDNCYSDQRLTTLEYDTSKLKIYSIFVIFGLFGMACAVETWPEDLDALCKKLGIPID